VAYKIAKIGSDSALANAQKEFAKSEAVSQVEFDASV
jgi:hypothetical protein